MLFKRLRKFIIKLKFNFDATIARYTSISTRTIENKKTFRYSNTLLENASKKKKKTEKEQETQNRQT